MIRPKSHFDIGQRPTLVGTRPEWQHSLCQIVAVGGYTLAQWALMVAITKFAGADAFGVYALALAISAPVFLALDGNLRNLVASDAGGTLGDGDYLRFKLLALALAVSITALLFARDSALTTAVALAVLVVKACESFSNFGYGLRQRADELPRVCASMLGYLAAYALCALSVYGLGSLEAGLAVLCLALLPIVALLDTKASWWRARAPGRARDAFGRLGAGIGVFGGIAMLNSLRVNLPVYVGASTLGATQLGVLAALQYLGVAAARPLAVLFNVRLTRVSRGFREGDPRPLLVLYGQLGLVTVLLGASGSWLVGLGDGTVLRLMLSQAHAEVAGAAALLLGAMLVNVFANLVTHSFVIADAWAAQFAASSLSCVAAVAVFALREGTGVTGLAASAALAALAALAVATGGALMLVTGRGTR